MLFLNLALLTATCVVQGDLESQDGRSIGGAEIVHAASGAVLGVTDDDGAFRVESPDPESTALEFRHEEWFSAVERADCGATLHVTMTPRIYQLEAVTYTAERMQRTWEGSAVREENVLEEVDVRDAEGGGASLAQVVQQVPGIGAIGRDGLTSSPTIRGLGRDRSLVLLEGVRLSSDRGVGPSGSFLDPFLLGDVSVVRGASGVSYGSGAIGGVISTDLGPVGSTLGGSMRLVGSTVDDGRLVAARLQGMELGSWNGAAGGFFRDVDDYSIAGDDDFDEGDASNSGFRNAGGTVLLERDVRGGRLRMAGLRTTADDIGRPLDRSNRFDTIAEEDHWLASVRYLRGQDDHRTEVEAGWHRPETLNRTDRYEDDGSVSRTGFTANKSDDFSAAVLLERPAGPGSWVAGADFFSRFGVDATEINEFPGPPYTASATALVVNARRLDVGVFGAWKRPVGLLGEARVAARVDWLERSAKRQESVDWVSPSLNAGVVKPLGVSTALTVSIGRSFRAPRIQELFFEGDRPGGSRRANPDLEPETAWSAETGVRWGRGAWSADATLWGVLAEELIVQLPVDAAGDTLQNFNESEGRLLGVELAARWREPEGRARASLSYAFLHGENEDGDPLPDIPAGEVRLAGAARVLGDAEGRSATLRLSMRAGAAKDADGVDPVWWSDALGSTEIGGDEVGVPGFARWDVGASLRVDPRVVLDLSVTNVLDSRYRDRPESDSFPQPGRSLRVELTLTS
jgi:iron complex outermembrane receptor protein